MSTILQKELAKNIVENTKKPPHERLKKQELVEKSGYSYLTADRNSKEIIENRGTQSELVALGFSEENAKRVVREILDNEENWPRDRLTAADMMFKVHGSYAPTKHVGITVDVAELQRAITEQIAQFRGQSKSANE